GLAFLQSAFVVALLRETRLRLRAAVAQQRVDVAAQQGRDVDLHRLAPHVVLADPIAVDRAVAVLRKHDRDFGADPGAGRTVRLAVVLIADLNLTIRRNAVHVEQAKAEALHAIRAAAVIDHREPRLPRSGFHSVRPDMQLFRRFHYGPCVHSVDLLKSHRDPTVQCRRGAGETPEYE